MLRVGIIGLLQESNTFIDEPTTRRHFEADLLLKGAAIRERMASAPHEVGGFFEVLDEAGVEAVPLFLARALPYGVIEESTYEELIAELLESVDEAGRLDGILAAPHGATVAVGKADADGDWLGRLRDRVGPDLPVIATLDPHANLSLAMVAATDAIFAYQTNPHLDQRETGKRAACLMLETLAGRVRPVQGAAFPPMAINIRSQNTSESPMREFYEEVVALAESAGVLSHSILLGFPYADVDEMGSAVLVVTDGEKGLAQKTAEKIAVRMWERREAFEPVQVGVAEAMRLAAERNGRPVVLLDMGDNVGGGAPANGTAIVQEWLRGGNEEARSEAVAEAAGMAFVCLFDRGAVEEAMAVGPKKTFVGSLGDPRDPVAGTWRVRSLHDGIFHETQARHGGFSSFDQGATAVLELVGRGLVVMATTRRMAPFSLAQLTSCGVDPSAFDVVIAKGVIAPMAAYAPIATGGFIHVDTPGVTRADMTRLEYHHRRRPMFPFERD